MTYFGSTDDCCLPDASIDAPRPRIVARFGSELPVVRSRVAVEVADDSLRSHGSAICLPPFS